MRNIIALIIFGIILASLASAEILIVEQPNEIYNLGDTINLNFKVVTLEDLSNFFNMNFVCNGKKTKIPQEYLTLKSGEEIGIEMTLPLIKEFKSSGSCNIQSGLGEVLTNDFKVSTLIDVELLEEKSDFIPGENLIINGEAKKENGGLVEGFVEAKIGFDSEEILLSEIVSNGYFTISYPLPEKTKADEYTVSIKVYEKDEEDVITNNGLMSYNLQILQVPTNLEIVSENVNVMPGTSFKIKGILHDQTGEKISSSVVFSVVNDEGILVEEKELSTDEFFEYVIIPNESVAVWNVEVVSEMIIQKINVIILENKNVKAELINKTLFIENIGNVFYNDSVIVKIGNDSVTVPVGLAVGGVEKYVLTAPNGEYQVEIIADGESSLIHGVILTGRAIDVKDPSSMALEFVSYPIVWGFIIVILLFVAFIIFKKGYKKTFFGYITSKKKETVSKEKDIKEKTFVASKNKAELSLSIEGDKQDVDLVCLKLKNFEEFRDKTSGVEQVLQNINEFAYSKKAVTYENQDYLFFLLIPRKTKTFKNEKATLEISQYIINSLSHHNKFFKQKVDFGVSLNYGPMIIKEDDDKFMFMGLGDLMSVAKKISSLSHGEVLVSPTMNSRIMSTAKTDKAEEGKVVFYKLREIKDNDQHKKFLKGFAERMDKDKNKK